MLLLDPKIRINEEIVIDVTRPVVPWHSLGKKIKLHEMKNEKNDMGFLIHKI